MSCRGLPRAACREPRTSQHVAAGPAAQVTSSRHPILPILRQDQLTEPESLPCSLLPFQGTLPQVSPSSCPECEPCAFPPLEQRTPSLQLTTPDTRPCPGSTFVKNILLPFLPRSLPAARTAASEHSVRSGTLPGPASDVSASCTGEWKTPSSPRPSETSKGPGPCSSGLEPSSLALALQRTRDREMDRNLVAFLLLPDRLCGSILREDVRLPFFLSWSLALGGRVVAALGLATPSWVPGGGNRKKPRDLPLTSGARPEPWSRAARAQAPGTGRSSLGVPGPSGLQPNGAKRA